MLKVDIMFVRENSLVAMLVTFGQGHTATRMAELSKTTHGSLQDLFFSCNQTALRTLPSVCHTFFTMFQSSYHHEIKGVINIDKSDVQDMVTEVETNFASIWD